MSKFAENLYVWHSTVERQMPWKENKDPYKIWLSEIILQQTRVEQGTPYFLKFIEKWPELTDLANATEAEVLTLWQGLGYYSRGRNLLNTAKEIVEKHDGVFPKNRSDLLKLKGIGEYTSAAILSFAFDLPYPVIDGNVKRVISRYFGILTPIDTIEGNKIIENHLNLVFDNKNPSSFNQAIMDFGALQCTPQPKCNTCPLVSECQAKANEISDMIPVKSKKLVKKIRFFNFVFIHSDSNFIIHQRVEKDIWQGLFQFPLVESEKFSKSDLKKFLANQFGDIKPVILDKMIKGQHILTHQLIKYQIHFVRSDHLINKIDEPYFFTNLNAKDDYAFPQLLKKFLNSYTLLD